MSSKAVSMRSGKQKKRKNDHTGADRAPDPKAVCLDCFCAEMQGNRRKAVIYMTDMNKLRYRAREWLNDYQKGDVSGNKALTLEETAAIVSEYLYETDPRKKAEGTSERVEELQAKAELLHEDLVAEQGKAAELEKRNKELEFQLAGASNRVLRLEGENSALRFAIRCNGVSGAEVRP